MRWGPDPNAAKTFIIQFIYQNGNGWAFTNAPTPENAKKVFLAQTIYKGAKVVNIKETKYYGTNTQLVFEGAVTTLDNSVDILSILDEANWLSKVQTIVDEAVANSALNGRINAIQGSVNAISSELSVNYYDKFYINNKLTNLTNQIINKQDKIVIDEELNETSTNPVTNAAVTNKLNELSEIMPQPLSYFYNDIDQTLIIR